jgi:5-deoxy-glucuronate isomerase
MTSRLLVKPDLSAGAAQVHHITPASAKWRYVGFDVLDLHPQGALSHADTQREACLVLLTGRAALTIAGEPHGIIGARDSLFAGKPFAVYAPPRCAVRLEAQTPCEIAVCSAPAEGRCAPRLIRPEEIGEEVRGEGTNTRYVRDILPASAPAEHLLVVEVTTPGGHWSSYPPHKHDELSDAETLLEEIYYHRLARSAGFAFQRVYTDDRTLDETMTVGDRDVVLVPRGYHPVSAAHGFDLYYLNVMAGPVRRWQPRTAPGYEFLTQRSAR